MDVERQSHRGRAFFFGDWAEKFNENRTAILLFSSGLCCVLFFVFYFVKQSTHSSENDYIRMNEFYQKWVALPVRDMQSCGDVLKTLKCHPELQGKYDALIAENLLFANQSKESELFVHRAWKRSASFSPHYADFAAISLLVAKGELEQAIKDSYFLKEKLEKDENFWSRQSSLVRFGSSLYIYNLLRIAILEQELGSVKAEFKAWEVLENYLNPSAQLLGSKIYHPEVTALFEQTFRFQDVSLKDYIRARKNTLSALYRG